MVRSKMKLCLVCSAGGHLLELCQLKSVWSRHERFWVTFDYEDTRCLLKGEKRYKAFYPTNRNIKNLLRNFFLAIRVLSKEKPDVIISTGAGVSVPFFYLAKLMRIKTIYIESLARVNDLSLSGKLVYRVTSEFIVQWKELTTKFPRTKYGGQVL
jgi:beta-1,4-N-acetylglucosaminyltransferase